MRGHTMDLWRYEVAEGGVWDRSHPGLSCWWVRELRSRISREGWRGVAKGLGGGGWEGRSTVSIIHAGVDKGRDLGRVSALGPGRLPSINYA